MLIVDVHEMRNEETSNNAQADAQPAYDPTVDYVYGDEVVYGDYIYYSINRENTGNQPDTSPLYWVIKENINRLKIYDKYPNSLLKNINDDIVIEYSVTDVDAIYIGNAHGDSIKVEAGATFTKNIPLKAHSAIDAWGVKAYSQMTDFYVDLGGLYSGTVKITISKSTDTNESALGFVNYGNLENVGCTLLNHIQYNIRSGGGADWANIDLNAFRAKTYTEIKLPIRIDEKTVLTKDVIEAISEYRGLPVLIVGDDEGLREETIFFGVYTDLEAKIADKNSYDIVLRSLSHKAFVAPTEIEQSLLDSQKALEEYNANNPEENGANVTVNTGAGVVAVQGARPADASDFTSPIEIIYNNTNFREMNVLDSGTNYDFYPMIDGFAGVPAVADFGSGKYRRQVIFDTTNPCSYYYIDGGNVKKCVPKVTTKNGVPTVADFNDSDIIFNTSAPWKGWYFLYSGTVYQYNPTVIAYTGQPPASAFSGGAEFIRDRSNPCDVYYLDGGTVKKCPTGGGGTVGGKFTDGSTDFDYNGFGSLSKTVGVQGYFTGKGAGGFAIKINGVSVNEDLMLLHVGDVIENDGNLTVNAKFI